MILVLIDALFLGPVDVNFFQDKSIIGEKHHDIRNIELVKRPMSYEDSMCYVNVGIRRAGKSWLLYQDILENAAAGKTAVDGCLYLNFEDERISEIQANELGTVIDCYQEMFGPGKPVVYLDEIQNIVGWEKFVRRLADAKFRVLVTGSNARMLSKDVATTLGGRFVIREVFPFSWQEYLAYHGIRPEKNWQFDPEVRLAVRRHFNEYFNYGGFAETFPLVGKREWLTGLLQKILMGDIISRYKIRNDRQLRMLVRKIADNVMQPTSISRFEHIIRSSGEKISNPTVKDYLGNLEDSYLIFSIPNYDSPNSEQETLRKRYFLDNGLLNLYLYKGETKLLENLTALHLRRMYGNAEEPRVFYFKRAETDLDFYVPEAGLAIQACFDPVDDATWEREVSTLIAFNKAFHPNRSLIVTYDKEAVIEKDGLAIEVIPIWKWLLE